MPSKPTIYKPHARAKPLTPRATAQERGYTARWQRASKAYLNEHPCCECEECKRTGAVVEATVVDHVIPHRGDMELFWDEANWCAMSKPHHDRKTATRDGGFGRTPTTRAE